MSILAKIGERLYEFSDTAALATSRQLYASCTGNQEAFESMMEEHGINFTIEFDS
jgi:hypothetical protein